MDMWFTIISCVFFMALVGWLSYRKSKGQVSDTDGYFLAGRGLTGGFIAASLLLTNLSAEQLIGLNGQAYRENLSNMAWEVTAAFAIIIMALILLPRYLGGAFSTLPQFLSERYDDGVRRYTVILFMLGYVLVTIPSVLYSGSVAIIQLFDVPGILGVTFEQSMWITIWVVGIIGSIYAIFGGLRAVAISDMYIGLGLVFVGLLVPAIGFYALGDGSVLEGVKILTTENPEKLNAIGSNTDSVPFGTIFTGMILMNLFYWGTNQYVIQRTLGAKNLAEGQKGVLYSGFYKIAVPFIMMLPGLIAFHLYGEGLNPVDLAYPTLVADLMPTFLSGLFLAVLLGAVFSSFNSLLNSASTMFALDVYQVAINKNATDAQLIRISKYFGTILALVSFFIAPLLMYAPEGLWNLIRQFTGFFNIPIIAIVLVGIMSKRIPAVGAKVAIIFHVITYYFLVWGLNHLFGIQLTVNFIYISAILFVIEVGIMVAFGYWKPLAQPYSFKPNAKVNMMPWKFAMPVTVVLVSVVVGVYIIFSPIGLAYDGGYVSNWFWPAFVLLIVLTSIAMRFAFKSWTKKYTDFLYSKHEKKVDQDASNM
nr:solute:sodium symporter family transporter [Shouchella patagoniensis]